MIEKALSILRPNAQWVCDGDTYQGITWLSNDETKPTEAEVNAEIAKLNALKPLEDCKEKAKQLIANCDWSVLPDVNISNKAEFEAYRATLRGYILNPVADPVFPTEPTPVWVQ